MIFQHSWEALLAGRKTQTSRIWKGDYTFSYDEYDREGRSVVLSMKAFDAGKIHRLYYVGQTLSVQKARGTKGIAKIRILELARRDVRAFDDSDVEAEGFKYWGDFAEVWASMHDEEMTGEWATWNDYMQRPKQFYDALVIKFELIENQ